MKTPALALFVRRSLFGLGLLLALGAAAEADDAAQPAGKSRVYVGTYTGKESRGIYLLELDPATGALESRGVAGETANPSFLALHPSRRFLYAVNEVADFDGGSGSVTAFAIEPTSGRLKELNRRSSKGSGPCHLVVDRRGKAVLVANYGGGSVAAVPIREDGRLDEAASSVQHRGSSVDKGRQEAPHAHCIELDAANRFAVAADLGLDKLLVYHFDSGAGTLRPNEFGTAVVAPGSGPRHVAFHPDGRHLYAINEMKSTVTAFRYDAERGRLEPLRTVSTLPADASGGNSTAEIQVHPSGRFVYGSNRGNDSIAIFAVEPESGELRPIGHQPTGGKTPRNFAIDPSGRLLLAANQDSGNVVVFRIDAETGRLSPTGHSARVPMPVCVLFSPSDAPSR